MNEGTPQFPGRLDNTEVSPEANAELEKLMERGIPAAAARRMVDEFRHLGDASFELSNSVKKRETAAEKRLKPSSVIRDALREGEGLQEYMQKPENAKRVEEAGLDKTDFGS